MIWATYSAHIQLGLHKSSIATHGTAFFCCCLHCLRLHHHHREWIKILSPPSASFPIWKSIFPLHWLLIPRVRKRRKIQRQALKYEFQFDNTGMLICLHTHTPLLCQANGKHVEKKKIYLGSSKYKQNPCGKNSQLLYVYAWNQQQQVVCSLMCKNQKIMNWWGDTSRARVKHENAFYLFASLPFNVEYMYVYNRIIVQSLFSIFLLPTRPHPSPVVM